jgi:hypothetical protein
MKFVAIELGVTPVIALVLFTVSSSAVAQDALPFKQVAAPAEDILSGRVVLPDPASCATLSRAMTIPVELAWQRGIGWSFETSVPVESSGSLALAAVSTGTSRMRVSVRTPEGAWVPIERAFAPSGLARRTQAVDENLPGWTIDRYDLASAPGGEWLVRVTAPDEGVLAHPPPAFLIARAASSFALSTHVTTLSTLSEREIGIVAHFYDADRADPAHPLRNVAQSGAVFAETSSGTQRVEMFDDGLHDDGAAGDGVFGARLPRWTSGEVQARVELRGRTAEGLPLARTAQLAFPVIERRTALTGEVTARVEDDLRLRIELGALPLGPASKLHVSTEVWGTNATGELVPVCWLSRMLLPEEPVEKGGEWKLPLFLDGRWLDVARAASPLALRNVRVQDPDTDVPYDFVEWLPLVVSALPPVVGTGTSAVTPDMLMSSALAGSHAVNAGAHAPIGHVSVPRALMLVHGYCSSGAIWPPADFTPPKIVFLDPNANRTHDQFAQLLLQAGSAYYSFGVVAHSQGGEAAVQLYTYYQSGLDFAVGPRRIQSVCSPYQGTPLASLGAFACGVNNDMTPTGSATWLAGIPSWARAEVYYWTTSNSGAACSAFTDFLLTNPEDGVVEMFRGQLPGAHSMGHVIGWCHTTGMSNPAAYTDHTRNAEMNAQAAR